MLHEDQFKKNQKCLKDTIFVIKIEIVLLISMEKKNPSLGHIVPIAFNRRMSVFKFSLLFLAIKI